MKPLILIILWLVIVLLFSAFGFFGPGHAGQIDGQPFDFRVAAQPVLFFGGIGFTIATCLATSLYALSKSRVNSITKISAIGIVLFGSVIGAVIPPVAVQCSGLYHGESAMEIVFQGVITIGISILAFIAFTIAILSDRQSHAE